MALRTNDEDRRPWLSSDGNILGGGAMTPPVHPLKGRKRSPVLLVLSLGIFESWHDLIVFAWVISLPLDLVLISMAVNGVSTGIDADWGWLLLALVAAWLVSPLWWNRQR